MPSDAHENDSAANRIYIYMDICYLTVPYFFLKNVVFNSLSTYHIPSNAPASWSWVSNMVSMFEKFADLFLGYWQRR